MKISLLVLFVSYLFSTDGKSIRPRNIEEMENYFQGDILPSKTGRNGIISEAARWPNGIIPYTISDEDFSQYYYLG
jgi:hypothetical protein